MGAQPGDMERDKSAASGTQTQPTAAAPVLLAQLRSLPCCQGGPVAWLTWARAPPGPGPLCGRMAGRAGAQSKLNLHLGVPGGRSSRRSHRSPLMASSKCGAAASAPRVRAPPPSPRALCKMVFTKVNIGRGARPGHREPRWPPLLGPHPGCHGLGLDVPTAPGPEEEPAGQTGRATQGRPGLRQRLRWEK